MQPAIHVKNFDFGYDEVPIFKKLNLQIPQGSRTLLAGANGVGKSTLLRILAGRHMVDEKAIQILGRSPFHDASLVADIGFVDGDFPITLDMRVSEISTHSRAGVDATKEVELIEILGVDLNWRMDRVSEGQRRRVQLMLAFRRNLKIFLLDEVTTHLDVLVRSDFLQWLKNESEKNGTTVVYTTHIFDGLWTGTSAPWPTHLAFLNSQGLKTMSGLSEIEELKTPQPSPLLTLCEKWMRADTNLSRELRFKAK